MLPSGVWVSLGGGVFGRWVSFGRRVPFGRRASFRCRASFGSSGAVWVSSGVVSVSYGGRWSVVGRSLGGGWWLVVVVRCAGVVTLRHAVVILLLWELTLVSNKVNKRTAIFIGSVAELLSLPFCVTRDPEVECSIPFRCNTFIWAFTCCPVSPVILVNPNKNKILNLGEFRGFRK